MPTHQPANAALAFEAVQFPEGKTKIAYPEMVGISIEDYNDRLEPIIKAAWENHDKHAEGIAYISQHVKTPQELAYLAWAYFDAIRLDKQISAEQGAANPHLAFAPATTDKKKAQTQAEMLGISKDYASRLIEIVNEAYDEGGTHSESLSIISQKAATPQELVLMGNMYFTLIERMDNGPKAFIDMLKRMKGVHVIEL